MARGTIATRSAASCSPSMGADPQARCERQCSGCGRTTDSATSVVTRAAAAIAKIREAQAELANLVDYDEPLYVMRIDVDKLIKAE